MLDNEYGCRMWIDTDNDDPNMITNITGIIPTRIEKKGGKKLNKKGNEIPCKQNLWLLEPNRRISESIWNLCDCIEDITDILDEQESLVRQVLHQYENKGILIFCNANSTWIQFRIQPEILYKMRKYNLLIDFSILGSDEED